MKKFTIDKILTLAFGAVVFAFFGLLYPYHLHYQEQYQMFLFTSDYLMQYLAKPGGLSDYIGNFFTQFSFYAGTGAAIIAVLLMAVQQTVWATALRLGAKRALAPLTFVPAILYWGLLCNENYLIGGVVALLFALLSALVYTRLTGWMNRVAFALISLPLLYWLSGAAFLVLPLFVIIYELRAHAMKQLHLGIYMLALIGLAIAMPYLGKLIAIQLPLRRVFIGVNFFRFPMETPYLVAVVAFLALAIPFTLASLSKKLKQNRLTTIQLALTAIVAIASYPLIYATCDMKKEEVMAYDFHVRMRKWDKVVEMALEKAPSSPLSVTCLNLALAKEGKLGDAMFHFYQKGVGGLMPDFTRDFTIPLITGEVYYHLGLINTAQRYAFEAMEALPDYQKSSRSVMRLAETNLINGHYEVAKKYLHLLQKTFYYKNWATKTLIAIQDEAAINAHPEWGWLRQCTVNEDFLFSEGEKDMMLGELLKRNIENKMAYEYLMAYCLLGKDLQRFMQYYPLGKNMDYNHIPLSYQEALTFAWGSTKHDANQRIPYSIEPTVLQRAQAYGQTSRLPNAENYLSDDFGDTYWYYLQFRN